MITDKVISKKKRVYFDENFKADEWSHVEKELKKIENQEIKSKEDLEGLIEKYSELTYIIEETYAWKYIKMTCNADNPQYSKEFNKFYAEVISKSQPYDFRFKKKVYESKYKSRLPEEKYGHFIKIISKDIEIFREENIPLMVKENELSNKYGEIMSQITVEFEGEEKTIIQMKKYLKDPDRKKREKAWKIISKKMLEKKEILDKLFDDLKEIRIKIAKNAGFDNYRDYMHKAKGRFDYTPEDIFRFHQSVEQVVIPFLKELNAERKEKLKVKTLRPWDTEVDIDGKVLKPFDDVEELVDKAINILYKVKPEFGRKLEIMKNSKFLDLENRKGKAPGGYNFPLAEHGAAFIFMNSVGLNSDVRTLLHEAGHAIHSFAKADEKISQYKDVPSEIAELASMSMELLTLEYLDEYYKDEEDLRKAKRQQLEGTIQFLPWAMIVDAFQQWIYTNPNHTIEERTEYFKSLMDRFNAGIDWSGFDSEKGSKWLTQLHIFEVPFYYIEYAIAQLGAIAIYKNYKEKGVKAIEEYENFLELGYSKSVSEVYKAAGIKFDFSAHYLKEIVDFIKEELKKI
ncbi:M3 family oligoendopeptidase [Paramaledivibacter caminithermalis]|uniref:Oligoendopeptidase F n=1 Tax=Paramaledivibacter caminithermalis (strain DSM 15212 / CIP 107654 / DViRD3) TaxID=1121301 RepID=A0A1M6RZX2_PARC5|nr:M3 family oligoendopeptidase [Paramaledivibacter caminithermalis]SHK37869.1 oligoendopeptidase F [Paramaledivibacter caminithermalis DSM 15212]